MQECGFPENAPVELEARRRPGRPPVHVWVDLPDELLAPEQKRKKRAILLRRARQQRLYERRKALRAALAQRQQADASATRTGSGGGSAISAQRYRRGRDKSAIKAGDASAGLSDSFGRLVSEGTLPGSRQREASGSRPVMEPVRESWNMGGIVGHAIDAATVARIPSPDETRLCVTGTGEPLLLPVAMNEPHVLQRIAVYDAGSQMRAINGSSNSESYQAWPTVAAVNHRGVWPTSSQPGALLVPLHWMPKSELDTNGPQIGVLPVHPEMRTGSDPQKMPGWLQGFTERSPDNRLPTRITSASAAADQVSESPAVPGDSLSPSAAPFRSSQTSFRHLDNAGNQHAAELGRNKGYSSAVMCTSPLTPSITDADFFANRIDGAGLTHYLKKLQAIGISSPGPQASPNFDQLLAGGTSAAVDSAWMRETPGANALNWNQYARRNKHPLTETEMEERIEPSCMESRFMSSSAVRNVSTADMHIFSPEALLKLYESMSAYEQRMFVRLTVPPACIDEELVARLLLDPKSGDTARDKSEATGAPEDAMSKPSGIPEPSNIDSTVLSAALNMLVEGRLLRRAGSCHIANSSWRAFVQRVTSAESGERLLSPELRERFRAEQQEAQIRFVKWILDRLSQDASAHPDGLHFDESVSSCIQRWCAESKNLLAALEFAAAHRSALLPRLLLHSGQLMRICIPPELRVEYLKKALKILRNEADLGATDAHADGARIELTPEKPQCMLVHYMPQSEEEAILLQALGEAYYDILDMAEAEVPLCQALRFFIGALAQSLGVSSESIEKLDDVCLDEEISRMQHQFREESSQQGRGMKPGPSQLNELTRKCQARMALLRMDMLLEVFLENFSDRCSDVSFVTTDHRSMSSVHSPSAVSRLSSRGKPETLASQNEDTGAAPQRLLLRCVLPLILLSQRIGLEGFRSEASDLLIMSLRILSALGLAQSTFAAAALLSISGMFLSSGQLMRARDVCYRALDVLRGGNFTSLPVFADALGMLGAVELIEGLRPAATQRFGAALHVLESWLDTYAGLPHEHCLNNPLDVQYLPLQHCRELHLWLSIGLARTCRAQKQHRLAARISRTAVSWWRRVRALSSEDPKTNLVRGQGPTTTNMDNDDAAYMEAVSLLPPAFQDFGNLRHVH